MILTKKEILRLINKKEIVITPLNRNNIGTASVDLTLDNKFRAFTTKKTLKINTNEKNLIENYKKNSKLIILGKNKPYLLKPNELINGITLERIRLPGNICGWLQGRTTFARVGLLVHATANFVHPGINNKQVLEIINLSPFALEIYPGARICQMVLEETKGEEFFKGWCQNQTLP